MKYIRFWHRGQNQIVSEKVPDRRILNFFYNTTLGRLLVRLFFSRKIFSRLYALGYRGAGSRSKIKPFIEKYDIEIEEFESCNYSSFNDFFIRRFKLGARHFVVDPLSMPAPAEARYLGWGEIPTDRVVPVKGRHFTAETLLGSVEKASIFLHGPVLIARLAPQDYHRVHFVDSGSVVDSYHIEGVLHSVNPIALSSRFDVMCANSRTVTIQKTEHYGTVGYIEVGAMTIGGINQTWSPGSAPQRGEEKCYFEYGGSTVIVLGQPGRWIPDDELLALTKTGIETFVRLGDVVAHGLIS